MLILFFLQPSPDIYIINALIRSEEGPKKNLRLFPSEIPQKEVLPKYNLAIT